VECELNKDEETYRRLQQHLDRQAVGFPAARSGADIRILKHIFTPREAEIASSLSHRPEPLETVFERAAHLVRTPGELAEVLDRIHKNGGIESRVKDGRRVYCNAPLVVGMYEMQLDRLTPEFIRDFDAYTRDRRFGVEFLSTDVPQMRTIPIARSIQTENHVSTFDEVTRLLKEAEGPFAIVECICRKKRAMQGKSCKATDRKETCLALSGLAQSVLLGGLGREIARDEAAEIIEQNQRDGLVLQPSNTQKADFICSCCGCCCGMLDLHGKLPRPLDFWSSNFQAAVDGSQCDGCGVCVRRCQVKAVKVVAKGQPAAVNLSLCIGCGLCVQTCPHKAIGLFRRPIQAKPPMTREDLYDIIMARKKSRLGKLRLTGKLFFDAIRTGRTDLLR
jgi:NAD-dependent dihydropyrimidine dehydrogenase PreA subunit